MLPFFRLVSLDVRAEERREVDCARPWFCDVRGGAMVGVVCVRVNRVAVSGSMHEVLVVIPCGD